MVAISFENVSFKYLKDSKFLLTDFDFEIKVGDKIGVIGGNGVGKSTLIKLILGINHPENGDILIYGRRNIWERNLSEIGYVGDPGYNSTHLGLPVNSTVKMIWDVLSKCYQDSISSKGIDMLSEGLNINALFNRNIRNLSTGERKRVMLATLLLKKPNILLLDEPLDGLDISVLPFVREELSKLCASSSKTVVYISHNRSEVDSYTNIVYELQNGQLNELKNQFFDLTIEGDAQMNEQFQSLKSSFILEKVNEKLKQLNQDIKLSIRKSK